MRLTRNAWLLLAPMILTLLAVAVWPLAIWPRLIMIPKIPANEPRYSRRNHAVLIFTMPGAPNAWA